MAGSVKYGYTKERLNFFKRNLNSCHIIMKKIFYNISLVKQDMQSCAQASAVQLLAYYGVNKLLKN